MYGRDFGSCWAKELELISTIVYVTRDLKAEKQHLTSALLLRKVREIKPKFAKSEILNAIDLLESKGHRVSQDAPKKPGSALETKCFSESATDGGVKLSNDFLLDEEQRALPNL